MKKGILKRSICFCTAAILLVMLTTGCPAFYYSVDDNAADEEASTEQNMETAEGIDDTENVEEVLANNESDTSVEVALPEEPSIEDFGDYVEEGGSISLVINDSTLEDGTYNQPIYEGVKQYACSAGVSYSYYISEGSADEDYTNALLKALSFDTCDLVVVAGNVFENVIAPVMEDYPDIEFLLVDCIPLDENGKETDIPENAACISFREEFSGYLAGYMSVLDGYRSFGFIGGKSVDSVKRYGYGYLLGIDDAAKKEGVSDGVNVHYWYAESFYPSDEIYDMADDWYHSGVEVIFCCGGGLYESVLKAAETEDRMIIGVDIDQNSVSDHVLTSAMKGVDRAVTFALDDYFAYDEWPEEMAGKDTEYGVDDYCTILPISVWRFSNVTEDDYDEVLNSLRAGDIKVNISLKSFPKTSFTVYQY